MDCARKSLYIRRCCRAVKGEIIFDPIYLEFISQLETRKVFRSCGYISLNGEAVRNRPKVISLNFQFLFV